ncbi:1-acyl-sn-glycerol-3-phosphate acyltransferase [Roseiconus nitratireducens]|uniref:1-acyl-sn-glycerol-3-phosphate acyltransferase n=1 Tax=Roseiconus nitratireducens TaxID=2605748 RepID=A0A5M6CWL6_9BACT|nr:lysophospholipid acyltransferase family protein [Roseiconus nitratireducens]KAA5539611.1 1-acyl-sn-glycerol-3-phosphate acyltransferase [Roseiconus nitratireducens]
MITALRYLFFLFIVRPVILFVIGLNVRRIANLPTEGPAVVVANHNSHLDTFVLMTLFGMQRLKDVHPVAAADHFLRNPVMAWFSQHIVGIIPLEREVKGMRTDPLAGICNALRENQILIIFPEGTRGKPEVREEFKTGIAHVAKRFPEVPFTPVFLHGLGKSLPKGEGILVPFFCDVFIGRSVRWTGKRETFMHELCEEMSALENEKPIPNWT